MANKTSDIFAYNKKNLKDVIRKNRGSEKARILKEMEFQRTHKFLLQPKKAKRLGIDNDSYGKWVKRKSPIPKYNLDKLKNEIRKRR